MIWREVADEAWSSGLERKSDSPTSRFVTLEYPQSGRSNTCDQPGLILNSTTQAAGLFQSAKPLSNQK